MLLCILMSSLNSLARAGLKDARVQLAPLSQLAPLNYPSIHNVRRLWSYHTLLIVPVDLIDLGREPYYVVEKRIWKSD